ncbi:DUF3397 domain-containing protein [Brevibacillus sp. TJ4]|uniref:DUF3397 domain-containing protein n=1 Tax=Brevibacillus sp. TJ4 TaxID=3234853 RepID=UPI0037D75A5C
MTVLESIWSFLWGMLTVIPFLGFPIAYLLIFAWKRDKRLACRWAVNVTNLLLIRSTVVAYREIWPESVSGWWWVFSVYFLLIALLGWMQIKWKGKLSLKKAGFSAWRLSFLLFGFIYVLLITTGVVKTMSVV